MVKRFIRNAEVRECIISAQEVCLFLKKFESEQVNKQELTQSLNSEYINFIAKFGLALVGLRGEIQDLEIFQNSLWFPEEVIQMKVILNSEIGGYIQTNKNGDIYMYIDWLVNKIHESIEYAQFLLARDTFLKKLNEMPSGLPALAGRINNHAAEVEAGLYSLRDVRNLVPRLNVRFMGYLKEEVE